jgi:hypothetical protein
MALTFSGARTFLSDILVRPRWLIRQSGQECLRSDWLDCRKAGNGEWRPQRNGRISDFSEIQPFLLLIVILLLLLLLIATGGSVVQ